ncbi:hypothetical protein M1N58_00520 [Dehalococcoidales bacterium]|nr:hypothetical protein [Dehalococcoidales bacterium]
MYGTYGTTRLDRTIHITTRTRSACFLDLGFSFSWYGASWRNISPGKAKIGWDIDAHKWYKIGPVGFVALGILEEPSLLMIGGLAGLLLIMAGTIAFIKKWQ